MQRRNASRVARSYKLRLDPGRCFPSDVHDGKRAYVDHATNCLDWGVFSGQNVDAGVQNRRSWTV